VETFALSRNETLKKMSVNVKTGIGRKQKLDVVQGILWVNGRGTSMYTTDFYSAARARLAKAMTAYDKQKSGGATKFDRALASFLSELRRGGYIGGTLPTGKKPGVIKLLKKLPV
jgi:hypothetical protein